MTLPDLEPLFECLHHANPTDDSQWHVKPGMHNAFSKAVSALAARSVPEPGKAVDISVQTMRLSNGRSDYFVAFKCGDREVTPHVFRERYKAEYHVALYKWLFGQEADEPNAVEFNSDDWPAIASVPAPSGAEPVAWREAMQLAIDYLKETKRGSPARSAGHNARLVLEAALDAPQAVPAEDVAEALKYATTLLLALAERHYPERSPQFAPLPDLVGVLMQIDNLTSEMVRATASEAQGWQTLPRFKRGDRVLARTHRGKVGEGRVCSVETHYDWQGHKPYHCYAVRFDGSERQQHLSDEQMIAASPLPEDTHHGR